MSLYIPDSHSKRWVILAPGRIARPTDTLAEADPSAAACPFCAGNESATPPELYRVGSGMVNTTGWDIRVVPNKYPITDIHEVIIHSPDHEKNIEDLPIDHVVSLFQTYRIRYQANHAYGQVMIFCNHGFSAGASLVHPHTQLAVVPRQITLDTITREPIANVVLQHGSYTAYCPDFSQWPYEVWVTDEHETGTFGSLNEDHVTDLAIVTRDILKRLKAVWSSERGGEELFQYNYYIFHGDAWYLRIIPRFMHRAGFELGTGLSVNTIDPKDAARQLAA